MDQPQIQAHERSNRVVFRSSQSEQEGEDPSRDFKGRQGCDHGPSRVINYVLDEGHDGVGLMGVDLEDMFGKLCCIIRERDMPHLPLSMCMCQEEEE